MAVRSNGLDVDFGCMHTDLDLGDMTLIQGHDTPLGRGQQKSKILSRSNMAVGNYSLNTDFGSVCTLVLLLFVGMNPTMRH